MPLNLTPGQYAKRALFYYQVEQLLGAGLTLTAALEHLERQPPARSYRQPLARLRESIVEGYTFSEALRLLGGWVPAFDLSLLEAGERSGRLDVSFHLLAGFYNERAQTLRQMIADFIYPVVLFHVAVFLLPFATLFLTANVAAYLGQALGILVPCYLAVAVLVYAGQSGHGERWRAGIERILRRLPLLGTGRRFMALSRLAAALEGLLSAGVGIVEAWELAADASGSPALRRVVHGWRPMVEAGRTPAEILNECSEFPELFANQYASGEISGKLEETLQRLQRYYHQEGSRKLHALAVWAPRMFYFAVVIMVAYRVVSFYSDHFQQILDAGGL